MPLTKATCTNCGAALEVDSSKEAAVCPYCNTAYIVEKAINNYNVTANNIVFSGENVSVKIDDGEKDRKFQSAAALLQAGDYKTACEQYKGLVKDYAYDDRSWIGFLRSYSFNYKRKMNIDSYLDMQTIVIKSSAALKDKEEIKIAKEYLSKQKEDNIIPAYQEIEESSSATRGIVIGAFVVAFISMVLAFWMSAFLIAFIASLAIGVILLPRNTLNQRKRTAMEEKINKIKEL